MSKVIALKSENGTMVYLATQHIVAWYFSEDFGFTYVGLSNEALENFPGNHCESIARAVRGEP